MIDQINEWRRDCDRSSLALWTSAGLLLAWDTAQTLRHGQFHVHGSTGHWALFLTAAAAAVTLNAKVSKATRRVTTKVTRYEADLRRLERHLVATGHVPAESRAWATDGPVHALR